jgi:hypothetical protein
LRIFLGFSDTGVNFGMAVMARRTGRRDHGMHGIPGAVADNGARAAGGGATTRVRAVLAGFAARAPRVREGEDGRGSEGDKRAQRKCFENTRDLVDDLLKAKNAGVTLGWRVCRRSVC